MGQFVMVPVELINKSSALGISDGMLRIIITVLQFARPNKLPFPSSKRVAKICGVSERTINRRCSELEKLGYLKRPKGGKKPYWDFSGLFSAIGYVPNPANEKLKISNTEDSEQKSLPNTEDSFGQSRYKKDNYIKDKDYKEEEKKKEKDKDRDRDKEINIIPRGVTGGNNTGTDKEPPCFFCDSDKGYHFSPDVSDESLFCNNCFNIKIEESDFKGYEIWKKDMDYKTRNAYEKYYIWTQINLKS